MSDQYAKNSSAGSEHSAGSGETSPPAATRPGKKPAANDELRARLKEFEAETTELRAELEESLRAWREESNERRRLHVVLQDYLKHLEAWRAEFHEWAEQQRAGADWKLLRAVRRFKTLVWEGRDEGRRGFLKWLGQRLLRRPGGLKNRYDPLDELAPLPLPPSLGSMLPLLPPVVPVSLRAPLLRRCLQGEGLLLELDEESRSVPSPLLLPNETERVRRRKVFSMLDRGRLRLDEPAAAADFCLAEGALEYVRNPLAALRELLRLLRPGGLLYLSVPDCAGPPPRMPVSFAHLVLDDREPPATRAAAHREELADEQGGGPARPARPRPFHAFEAETFRALIEEVRAEGCGEIEELVSFRHRGETHHAAMLRRPARAKEKETAGESAKAGTVAATSAQTARPPALMMLLHADPYRPDAGGTERCVLDRAAALQLPRTVLVYPLDPERVEVAEIYDGRVGTPRRFRFPVRPPLRCFSLRHPVEDLPLWLARLFGVGAVSVEHLLRRPAAAVERLHQAGLPYIFAVHDFYCLCPNWCLLTPEGQPCRRWAEPTAECAACLEECFKGADEHNRPPSDLWAYAREHRHRFAEILRLAAAVVVPSESARERVATAFPEVGPRLRVIPHGLPAPRIRARRPRPGKRLRLALLGGLASKAKGGELLTEIVRRASKLPVEWHLFGEAESSGLRNRLEATGAHLVFHGPYEREEIVNLLVACGAEAALFTSVAPETFGFTLSEAWAAGLPAIAPRLGALGERVERTGFGWTVEPCSPVAAVELLERLCADRSLARAARQRLKGFRHPTPAENAAAWREVLTPLLFRSGTARTYPSRFRPPPR